MSLKSRYGTDVAFLENQGNAPESVEWNGANFTVDSGASLLISGPTAIFSTSNVTQTGTVRLWTPVASGGLGEWTSWADPAIPATVAEIPAPTPAVATWTATSAVGRVARTPTPLEQVNFTEYDTEICVYSTMVDPSVLATAVAAASSSNSIGTGSMAAKTTTNLTIASAVAQAWTIFINGRMVGTGSDLSHRDGASSITCELDLSVAIKPSIADPAVRGADRGANTMVLTMLSTSLGVGNGGGVHNTNTSISSTGVKGVTSSAPKSVMLGTTDITSAHAWTQQAGSTGEALGAGSKGPCKLLHADLALLCGASVPDARFRRQPVAFKVASISVGLGCIPTLRSSPTLRLQHLGIVSCRAICLQLLVSMWMHAPPTPPVSGYGLHCAARRSTGWACLMGRSSPSALVKVSSIYRSRTEFVRREFHLVSTLLQSRFFGFFARDLQTAMSEKQLTTSPSKS
jgi:hypothetical protein